MRKSSLAHGFSIVLGIVAGIALVATWLTGRDFYQDSIALFLASIASAVCALIYLKQER